MPTLGSEQLAPAGARARVETNLEAPRVLRELEREQRWATADQLRVLARWGSWGSVPQVFDQQRGEWAGAREQLRGLVGEEAYAAAQRTTINAHYTEPGDRRRDLAGRASDAMPGEMQRLYESRRRGRAIGGRGGGTAAVSWGRAGVEFQQPRVRVLSDTCVTLDSYDGRYLQADA